MKKLLLLTLFFTGIINAQIVNIPDANLKARLLASDTNNSIAQIYITYEGGFYYENVKIDTNNDGEIQVSEALLINVLNINSASVSSLAGLEGFVNLKILNCNNNQLTSLDLTVFPNIYDIDCSHNLITNVNINGITELGQFICSNNAITAIDLSGIDSIYSFGLDHNQLTSLTATNMFFADFDCTFNNITEIDISGTYFQASAHVRDNPLQSLIANGTTISSYIVFYDLPTLTHLDLSNSLVVELDIHTIPNLQNINLENTSIYFLNVINSNVHDADFSSVHTLREVVFTNSQPDILDFSGTPDLIRVEIKDNPNLFWVNLKNGSNESTIIVQNNPNLNYLCVDDAHVNYVASIVGGSVNVNSYCSFVPGGNYNTISGIVTFDSNNNGCDISDDTFSGIKLSMPNGSSCTNTNGSYGFFTQNGNFTITPNIENPTWFTFSPPSVTVSFPDNQNNSVTQNFCIAANMVHNDVEIVLVPLTAARPGFDVTYEVVFKNKGNQTLSGDINFTYVDDVMDFISSSIGTNAQSFGNLNWVYSDLHPFETRSFTVEFNVNSPMATPAVNIGDELALDVSINPIVGDDLPTDNSFSFKHIVVGSFDPNDKNCLEGNTVSPTQIGKYLHYNINFENTGTFQAENIVVKDIIDTTKFDISSLQVMNASHPLYTRIVGNKVEFIFENINLGAGQHGNVTFKIKTKSTLVTGNTVTNSANIYFDYNAPVATNTASTTFQALGLNENEIDNSINVYPNPANNSVNVTSQNAIKTIQLFDMNGRILMTKISNGLQASISISDYANGIYFLIVSTQEGIKTQKIIKE